MLRSFRRHLSFANVTAILALVVALGGTSYAAVTLTGKNIKNGSLTGKDIKNRSLATTDLSKKAVKSLTGKRGAIGPAGPVGAKGDPGSGVPTGANITGGQISLGAGSVANGRCKDFQVTAAGAVPGQAVLISHQGTLDEGSLIYGASVPSAGFVTMKVCNLTGVSMPAISNLPVRIITFG